MEVQAPVHPPAGGRRREAAARIRIRRISAYDIEQHRAELATVEGDLDATRRS
jgi:hypothetical protein